MTIRPLLLSLFVLLALAVSSRAADVDGVPFPEAQQIDGKVLRLNGAGSRTWSLLNIHIYVAGLYLEHPNRDPDAIIHSPEAKLLTFRFQRDIDAKVLPG